MKNTRKKPKLAAKIDKEAEKQKASKRKETKKTKRTDGASGMRPIGDDFSSQNEEAEDELSRVGRGPK
jgi:hypothetical protein